MVNAATIIHVPNKPMIQFCHIPSHFSFPSIHPRLRLPTVGGVKRRPWQSEFLLYIKAILIPQPLNFCY